MSEQLISETTSYLEQWGLWSRNDKTGALSCTHSAMFSAVPSTSKGEDIYLSEIVILRIDSVANILKQSNNDAFNVLLCRYYYDMTVNQTAKAMSQLKKKSVSKKQVEKLESSATHFICGAMYANEEPSN